MFSHFYSYLIASIGSSLAAFFAGYHPKKTPVNVQTAKLIIMLQGSIWVAIWKKEFRQSDKLTPNITPIIPPVTESKIASIRNWFKISIPRAPTLIRRPISRVRSVTDTYIVHDSDAAYQQRDSCHGSEQDGDCRHGRIHHA